MEVKRCKNESTMPDNDYYHHRHREDQTTKTVLRPDDIALLRREAWDELVLDLYRGRHRKSDLFEILFGIDSTTVLPADLRNDYWPGTKLTFFEEAMATAHIDCVALDQAIEHHRRKIYSHEWELRLLEAVKTFTARTARRRCVRR
jgi:hypothetical protein